MFPRKLSLLLTIIVTSIGTYQIVFAQSGSRNYVPRSRTNSAQSRQGSAPRAEQTFEQKLWAYLQDSNYRVWAPMPGQSDDAYNGNSPHGAKVKLYVNRTAAGGPNELRNGSILIKENYDNTGEKLMAITAMYRSRGYNAEGGDWYWVKYETNGAVSSMNGMPIAGRVKMCIDCHQSAGNNDFVFANDQ